MAERGEGTRPRVDECTSTVDPSAPCELGKHLSRCERQEGEGQPCPETLISLPLHFPDYWSSAWLDLLRT